jgi:hypothetical protein
MAQDRSKNWQDLCQAAATEQDPKKLMALVAELLKALDDSDRKAISARVNKQDCGASPLTMTPAVARCDETTCENGL